MENKDFIVKKNTKGFAVYAKRDFRSRETICVFKGKKSRPKNLATLLSDFQKANINPLQIGKDYYLQLDKPYIYFNHSCSPNAGFRKTTELFALKNTKKGQEIVFDYSTTIDESFDCKCGVKNCRGAISDFFVLPKNLQQYYFKQGALQNFIKQKMIKNYKGNCPCGSRKKYKYCHGK